MRYKAMSYRELSVALAKLTDEQLNMPVMWSGEDRGGLIGGLDVLKEEHINCGEGLEPRSAYAAEPPEVETRYEAGTVCLLSDMEGK